MPTIKKIIETTERTVENLITKEGEFQFLNGGFVREDVKVTWRIARRW